MSIVACSVEGCEEPKSPKAGKGMCGQHYRRWKAETAPRCAIDECDKSTHGKDGLCAKHHTRLKRHGSTSEDVLVRGKNEGNCPIDGCENPMRSIGLCASHATQKRRIGEAKPFTYKWAERGNCKVCGKPCTERGRREYCSGACQAIVSRNQAIPPQVVPCGRCGADIHLGAPIVGGGRKGRLDKATCDDCKRVREIGQKTSASDLAKRDGTDCSICGDTVDMSISYPDLQSASVDHVIAYSRGGSHDPSNLALSHLVCNIRKRNHAA